MNSAYDEYVENQMKASRGKELPKYRVAQQKLISDFLSNYADKDSRILSIGCHSGNEIAEMKKCGIGKKIWGIDINPLRVETAKKEHPSFKVFVGDMHNLKFKNNFFDVVYSSHSFEHSLHPDKALSEFKRVVKDDGTILIIIPFPDNGNFRIHSAAGKIGTRKAKDDKRLMEWLDKNGVNVIEKKIENTRGQEILLALKKKK
ncbi:MAG: class I SAM-dependent methyltransferase [Candidatus Thorarchaeota archaeon]|jgi:ubiquinone/menaquinone biosynthesis C-methylase UbiE